MSVKPEPVRPGPGWEAPRKLLVIAGFFRSGSSYHGSLLRSTRHLGCPEEYFNPRYRPLTAFEKDGAIDFQAAFSTFRDMAITANGIAAIKLFPPEFEYLLTRTDFSAWFPDTRFIWLQRGDLLGQAVSLSIAGQTGAWQQTGEASASMARFDRERIDGAIKSISDAHRYWASFFARNGIVPQIVTYEALCRNPEKTVREIAGFMDCALPQSVTIRSELRRQSNRQNADFRSAYLSGQERLVPAGDSAKRVVPRTFRSLRGLVLGQPI